jgi:uncharacterized protein YraI
MEDMTGMKPTILAAAAFAAAAVAPAVADAAFNGWTTRPVQQKAGPAEFYPTVGGVPGGVQVRVFGCVRGITYCDVSWRGNRGWVRGSALAGFYKNKRVPLAQFGVQIGVPYITFNFGYWDNYYKGKPWFKERSKWDKNWKGGKDWKDNDRNWNDKDWKDNKKPIGMKPPMDDKSGPDWKKEGDKPGPDWKKANDGGPTFGKNRNKGPKECRVL